jgi:hypothetical protein
LTKPSNKPLSCFIVLFAVRDASSYVSPTSALAIAAIRGLLAVVALLGPVPLLGDDLGDSNFIASTTESHRYNAVSLL